MTAHAKLHLTDQKMNLVHKYLSRRPGPYAKCTRGVKFDLRWQAMNMAAREELVSMDAIAPKSSSDIAI